MRIVFYASDLQREEIVAKGINSPVDIIWIDDPLDDATDVDAYFDLLFDEINFKKNHFIRTVPVFANAVLTPASCLPENYIRINAWNGFLKRDKIEIATANKDILEKVEEILEIIGWRFIVTPDEPGMIAARIISMIINEAYFALGEQVSTKAEMDTAMKLGTNYPYGPFEWSEKIGRDKIVRLLEKLQATDDRYSVAPLLLEEVVTNAGNKRRE